MSRESLLPDATDLPAATQIDPLENEEQMVLNVKLDAPTNSLGTAATTEVFDPAECGDANRYTDAARIGLIEDGSGNVAIFDDGARGARGYVVLVSETDMDVPRVAAVHTGTCSTYTITSTSADHTYRATVRTEKLPLSPELGTDDAVVLAEVTDPDIPAHWQSDDILLGYAALHGYTVMVLGRGRQYETEFNEVFTAAVQKVLRHT